MFEVKEQIGQRSAFFIIKSLTTRLMRSEKKSPKSTRMARDFPFLSD